MSIDETMSQDNAFTSENQDAKETFKFDEVKETSPDSQTNEESKADETTDESSSPVGNDSEEQKVPYSRFKKKVDELNENAERISFLEAELERRANSRTESTDDDVMPPEWKELYGDNEVAQKAWSVQKHREEEIQERAIERAIERMQDQQIEEVNRVAENEETIDDNLADLQEKVGKKLTTRQEEEILGIVDEFSPVGDDGKYVSLFPFDKAYEIYTLRNSQKGAGTREARKTVADLAGNASEGEIDSNSSDFKRGWDSWREGI